MADRNTHLVDALHAPPRTRSGRLSARRRQPEAVLDEHVLAAAVALVLAVQLGHGHVALVDDEEEVVGEVVEQRVRRLARSRGRRWARVVLDAVAVADLLASSRGRTGCACAGAAPRAACPPPRTTPAAPAARPRCRTMAAAHALVAGDVVGGGEHDDARRARSSCSPVSGSTTVMRSTSSPNSSMRSTVSS